MILRKIQSVSNAFFISVLVLIIVVCFVTQKAL